MPPHWQFPLTPFLAGLQQQGVRVGTDTHIALQQLLRHLMQHYRFPEDIEAFGDYLVPLLVQDKDQQAAARALYKQWFGKTIQETPGKAQEQPDKPGKKQQEKQTPGEAGETPYDKSEPPQPDQHKSTEQVVVSLRHGQMPAQGLSFAVEQVPLQWTPQTLKALRQMRFTTELQAVDFDVEATIARATEQGGFARPVFRPRRRHVEYLFVIEQDSVRNHQARFIHELAAAMQDNNLDVLRYPCRTDPRILYSREHPRGISLSQVQARHNHAILLYFGNGMSWFHPSSLRLYYWTALFKGWHYRFWFPADSPDT